MSILDIPYFLDAEKDPFRQFDFYASSDTNSRPLLCFVHGGAWRSEDKKQHSELAKRLVEATGCPVAVPNYRLSPKSAEDGPAFFHPGHAEDILHFLQFIITWNEDAVYDRSRIYLIGHSCSAHMLSAIVLDSSKITPALTPADDLLAAVQGCIFSEGIYDIDKVLDRFPQYREWFIASAFGDLPSYEGLSVASYPLRTGRSTRWLLIHSKGDTLVDVDQSQGMVDHLRALPGSSVVSNLGELDEEHDLVLQSPKYTQLIADFVSLS